MQRRISKAHWVSDAKVTHCAQPGCGKQFNWSVRKHHCRMCGLVFCDTHSSRRLRLDADHRPNNAGDLSRVCDGCFRTERDGRTPAPASVAVSLKLHVAGEVVFRDKTAFYRELRAASNRGNLHAMGALVEAYTAMRDEAISKKPAIAGKKLAWKGPSDSDAVRCGVCSRGFTQLIRRHHCRLCAKVVCDTCSAHRKASAADGAFVYRSCYSCNDLLERHGVAAVCAMLSVPSGKRRAASGAVSWLAR